MVEAEADLVNGPVQPEFLARAPQWATAGGFFRNPGTHCVPPTCCSGHHSFRAIQRAGFLPQFNFSGGEDYEFLTRLVRSGARKAVAPDAPVRELIPATRLTRMHIWRRGLRDGIVGERMTALLNLSGPRYWAHITGLFLRKCGFALNHLFWAITTPWRLTSAIADLAAAAGIFVGACGREFRFYGRDPGQHSTETSIRRQRGTPRPKDGECHKQRKDRHERDKGQFEHQLDIVPDFLRQQISQRLDPRWFALYVNLLQNDGFLDESVVFGMVFMLPAVRVPHRCCRRVRSLLRPRWCGDRLPAAENCLCVCNRTRYAQNAIGIAAKTRRCVGPEVFKHPVPHGPEKRVALFRNHVPLLKFAAWH